MQCNADAFQHTCIAAQCSAVQHRSHALPEVGVLRARCYHVLQGGLSQVLRKGAASGLCAEQ
eukprot:16018903-Heterocapsa_arctica.AAC.1